MEKPKHMMRFFFWKPLLLSLILVGMVACQQSPVTPTVDVPRVVAKQLATVLMPPTPDEAARQATQSARIPVATSAPPTATPTATAYVGIFIGEYNEQDTVLQISPIVEDDLPTSSAPTPVRAPCEAEADPAFGTTWKQDTGVERRLGCAIQILFAFKGNLQVFEGGVMYWREDTGEIWAIAPGGLEVGQYWYVAEATFFSTETIVAPEGMRVPERGFGSVWLGVPGVREALGYAQTGEQRIDIAMQRFDSGTLLLDSEFGTVFALMVNGDAYGPY